MEVARNPMESVEKVGHGKQCPRISTDCELKFDGLTLIIW